MKELLMRVYAFLLEHYPNSEIRIHPRHLNIGDKVRECHFVSVWINGSVYWEKTRPQIETWIDKEAPLPLPFEKN